MTAEAKKEPRAFASWLSSLPEKLIPVLAVVTALAIGAIVIWATKASVVKAYRGLIEGALFGVTNFTETLVIATPYTLAGLAVALASRCGLFNMAFISSLLNTTGSFLCLLITGRCNRSSSLPITLHAYLSPYMVNLKCCPETPTRSSSLA